MSEQELNKENLKYQYLTLDKSRKYCAEYFDCTEGTLKSRLRKYKIKKPSKKANIGKNDLHYYYITLNKSREECGKYFGYSEATIQKYLKKYKIKKDKKQVSENIKKAFIKKYGVDNPAKLDAVKEKIKDTNRRRYETDFFLSSSIARDKIKQTNLERYGTECNLQVPKVREKIVETNLKKYGVDNPAKSDIIKEKIKKTNMKKYGRNAASQSHINNYNIWENDNVFIEFLRKKKSQLNRKLNYQEISEFFNVDRTLANKRILDLDKNKKYNIFDFVKSQASYFEQIISDFLDDNGIIYEKNNRKIIKPLELDFVIKDKKIAIEMNDTWSHCTQFITKKGKTESYAKNYHNMKTELCSEAGYRLIHIFEKDLNDLDNIFGFLLPAKKINGRDLTYKHNFDVKDFIIKNHQQGTSLVRYGGALLLDNEIIGAITFRKQKDKLCLDKLCIKNGYNIRGGSSKLFKNYLKNINLDQYESIITFCDTTYHTGKVYEKLGFKPIKKTRGMYYWVKGDEWNFRRDMQKSKLQKRFNLDPEYVKTHTEREICNDLGYVSIYTSDMITFEYKL